MSDLCPDGRRRGKSRQSTGSVTQGEKPGGQAVEERRAQMFGGGAAEYNIRRSRKGSDELQGSKWCGM